LTLQNAKIIMDTEDNRVLQKLDYAVFAKVRLNIGESIYSFKQSYYVE